MSASEGLWIRSNARRRPRREINIVPLVDVLIVLIFFFMMTKQLEDEKVLNITPPEMETAGQNNVKQELVIAVNLEGQYFYNNSLVSKEELGVLIQSSGQLERAPRVLLIADEASPLGQVTWLMDTCRKHGLDNIKLQTR